MLMGVAGLKRKMKLAIFALYQESSAKVFLKGCSLSPYYQYLKKDLG